MKMSYEIVTAIDNGKLF